MTHESEQNYARCNLLSYLIAKASHYSTMHPTMQEPMVRLVLILLFISFPAVVRVSSRPSLALPGCPEKCGDVSIPYPFGIGVHCSAASLSSYFVLTCNDTTHPPHPAVGDNEGAKVEITDISLERGEMRVLSPVSHICFSSNTTSTKVLTGGYELRPTPFLPSPSRNHFMVIGCNTLGLIGGYKGAESPYVAGCYSYCESIDSTSDGAPCAGLGCCEAAIPANLTDFGIMFEMNQSKVWDFNPCFYAMVVEAGWYSFRQQDLVGHLGFIDTRAKRGAPIIADWAVRNSSCPEEGKEPPNGYACLEVCEHRNLLTCFWLKGITMVRIGAPMATSRYSKIRSWTPERFSSLLCSTSGW